MPKSTYALHKRVKLVQLFNGTSVHWAYFVIRKGSKKIFLRKFVPCRSSLYKLLTHFYFKGRFSQDEAYVSITEEDRAVISNVFEHRKDYLTWRKIYGILELNGTEVARKVFEEKAKLFGMINLMKEGSNSNL